MAISSKGYPGTIAPGADWALMQHVLGSHYCVSDVSSVRVTPKTNGTREVNIAAGLFGAWGIVDVNDATASVQLPLPTSTQYHWIWARRTWQGTNLTTFTSSPAGATLPTVVPTSSPRNTTPGTIDDQPLALVSITAGQTVPVVVADLRWIGVGTGTKTVLSDLARTYATWSGPEFQQGDTRWLRTVNPAGTATIWREDAGPFKPKTLPVTTSLVTNHGDNGWSAAISQQMYNEAWRDGNTVTLTQLLRRSGSTITPSSIGAVNTGVDHIGDIPAAWAPSRALQVPCRYRSGDDGTRYSGVVQIYPNGAMDLIALAPTKPLTFRAAASETQPWCLEFSATYVQKG